MAKTDKLPKDLRNSILNARRYLPKWLKAQYEELDQHPELNEKNDEISDFLVLIKCIWRISNQDYQERIWVNHETSNIVDSFDDTTMYFNEDTYAVLKAYKAGQVKMTQKQKNMLETLYEKIRNFESSLDYPTFSNHDKDIIGDPRWHKIRDYAKLVYQEITGEDA